MAEIIFSPEAVNDLQQTRAYISEELCNKRAAIHMISDIMKHIRIFSQFPQRGASLFSIVDFETDYCFLVCGNYAAFYRVEGQAVFFCPYQLFIRPI